MAYTNSPLVNYTKLSPNHSGSRTHAIDTITIHCVVGQCTVERLGEIFAPVSRQASSNYGVGLDGRIGMYVEEKNRSWCTSSNANDQRAITIEVASDTTEPYAVRDAAYQATIKLVADICKRNGIKKLVWSTNKETRMNHLNGCNMTVHRDYANKSCPGTYLYTHMGDIAEKVNVLLGIIKEPKNPSTPKTELFKVGDIVKIASGAVYYDDKKKVPAWVRAKTWIIRQINGDRIVIDKSEDGKNAICSPINAKYLSLVNPVVPSKSIDDLAKEVINGDWGNGADRKNRLTAAGYDYAKVQARVNELCAAATPKPAEVYVPKKGDIVNFKGNKHYSNANATSGYYCKPGKAKITQDPYKVGKSKHPYHLVAVSGGGSNVYGWVDAGTFEKA